MEDDAFTNVPETDTIILSKLDIDDLHNTCQLNNYVYTLCIHDKKLREKLRVYYITNYFLELLESERKYGVIDVNFDFTLNKNNILKLLPSKLKNIVVKDKINLKQGDKLWLSLTLYDDCDDESCSQPYHHAIQYIIIRDDGIIYLPYIEISLDDLTKILYELFYENPKIKAFDQYYQSYLPDDDMFKLYEDTLASGEIYDNGQYKLIINRVNFWDNRGYLTNYDI